VIDANFVYKKEMPKMSSAYFVFNNLMGRATPIFLRTNLLTVQNDKRVYWSFTNPKPVPENCDGWERL